MANRLDTDSPLAWIALRKSRAEEDEERKARLEGREPPDVLRHHRETLLRLAADHDLAIPPENIFEDIESGEYLDTRPAFLRLLALLRELPPNAGGVLFCMAIDRLSRGVPSERAYVQETLDRAGILVVTPSSVTNLRDPSEALLYEVRGSLARHELQQYKVRVRATLDSLVRQGQVRFGAACYGYRWSRDLRQLLTHPEEFPRLQSLLIDVLYLSVQSLSNRYGIPRPTILQVLRNPTICGWPAERYRTWRDERTGKQRTRLLPRSDWIWPEKQGTYPAACSRAHWEQVQAVLDHRRKGRSRQSANSWCREVLLFVQAPGPVRLGTWAGQYETYERNDWGGPRLYIDRKVVHAAADETVLGLLQSPETLRERMEAYRAAAVSEGADMDPEAAVEGLQREMARARRKLDELLALELEATDAEERASIGRVRSALRSDLSRLADDLHQARLSIERIPQLDAAWADLWEMAEIAAESWPRLDGTRKALFAEAIIERIEVACIRESERSNAGWLREVVRVVVRAPFRLE